MEPESAAGSVKKIYNVFYSDGAPELKVQQLLSLLDFCNSELTSICYFPYRHIFK